MVVVGAGRDDVAAVLVGGAALEPRPPISTDKAADPSSVLGYSKRIAECLTAHVAPRGQGTFLSVRFGNVLGSRGSVLGIFQSQIGSGGPITVTDPDVTRYFMTIAEACELVIQAGAAGKDGEALVLDMGEPVRIDDVARRMAAMSDRPVEIEYTGLRPGEKLDEVLFGQGEPDVRPVHPLISHVPVPALEPAWVLVADPLEEVSQLTARLADLSAGRHLAGAQLVLDDREIQLALVDQPSTARR